MPNWDKNPLNSVIEEISMVRIAIEERFKRMRDEESVLELSEVTCALMRCLNDLLVYEQYRDDDDDDDDDDNDNDDDDSEPHDGGPQLEVQPELIESV
jgi:hypothetical protein